MSELADLQNAGDAGFIPDATLGAIQIGYAFTLFFYGVTLAQAVMYFRTNTRDLAYLKGAVFALLVVDSVHVGFLSAGVYTYLVTLHGNEAGVFVRLWSIGVTVFVTNISNTIVRCIYAHRIWRLTNGGYILPLTVMVLSLTALVLGLLYGTESIKSIIDEWCAYAGSAVEAVADVIIVIAMFRIFLQLRFGLPRTDSVLQMIMVYSISTGLLTAIFVVFSLVVLVTLPQSWAGIAIYNILSKLYINALLAALNARRRLALPHTESIAPVLTTQIAIGPSLSGVNPESGLGSVVEYSWSTAMAAETGTEKRAATLPVSALPGNSQSSPPSLPHGEAEIQGLSKHAV